MHLYNLKHSKNYSFYYTYLRYGIYLLFIK
nr:MAG TPA: hypothetical protein [Bacteriophage sp.]